MNFRSFNYTEYCEGPEEQWGESSRMVRILDLAKGDFTTRMNAVADILGYPTASYISTGSSFLPYLSRTTPMPYGGSPNPTALASVPAFGPMRATRIIRSEPLGKNTGVDSRWKMANYERWRMYVEFQYLPAIIKEDNEVYSNNTPFGVSYPDEGYWLASQSIYKTRYVTKIVRPYQKFRTIPFGCMAYADTCYPVRPDNNELVIVREGFPINEIGLNVIYQWLQCPVPNVPWTAIGNSLGCVNDSTFDNYPAGTLLLTAAQPRNYFWATGQWLADVEYHMNYLPRRDLRAAVDNEGNPIYRGWNSAMTLLDTDTGNGKLLNWYPVVDASSHTNPAKLPLPPFASADFSALFRPQNPPDPIV